MNGVIYIKKAKLYLTLIFFIILNICSIQVLNNSKPTKLIMGYPLIWFKLYSNGKFLINLAQLFLHIAMCYALTIISIKIIKKYT